MPSTYSSLGMDHVVVSPPDILHRLFCVLGMLVNLSPYSFVEEA
jgi:hypothetical protein